MTLWKDSKKGYNGRRVVIWVLWVDPHLIPHKQSHWGSNGVFQVYFTETTE